MRNAEVQRGAIILLVVASVSIRAKSSAAMRGVTKRATGVIKHSRKFATKQMRSCRATKPPFAFTDIWKPSPNEGEQYHPRRNTP